MHGSMYRYMEFGIYPLTQKSLSTTIELPGPLSAPESIVNIVGSRSRGGKVALMKKELTVYLNG